MSSLGIAAGLLGTTDLRSAAPGQATQSGRDGAFGAMLDRVSGTDDPPKDPVQPAPAQPGDAAIPAPLGNTVHNLATRATGAGDDLGRNAPSRTPIDVTAWAAALADGAPDAAVAQVTKGGSHTGLPAIKLPKAPNEPAIAAGVPLSPVAPTPVIPEPAPAATTSASDDQGGDAVLARTAPTVLRDANAGPGLTGGPAATVFPGPSLPPGATGTAPNPGSASAATAVVTPAETGVSGRPTPAIQGTSAPAGSQGFTSAAAQTTASTPSVVPDTTQASPQLPGASTPVAPPDANTPASDRVEPVTAATAAAVGNIGSGTVPRAATAIPQLPQFKADAPASPMSPSGDEVLGAVPQRPADTQTKPSAKTDTAQSDNMGTPPVAEQPDAGPGASPSGGDAGSSAAAPDQAAVALAAGQGQAVPAATPQVTSVTPAAPAKPIAAGTPAAGRTGGAGSIRATLPDRSPPVVASMAAGVFNVAKPTAAPAALAVAPAVSAQPDAAATVSSAVGQIVMVLQDLGRAAETSGPPAGAATASPDAAPGGATPGRALANREVTIQLNPENLGTVQVKMRMRADTIDIRIEVANPQTLHLLDKDRHLLSAAVEALGGGPKALALSGPEPATTAAARADPQNPFTSAGSSGGDGRPAAQRATPTSRSNVIRETSDVQSDTRPDRADSSLYL